MTISRHAGQTAAPVARPSAVAYPAGGVRFDLWAALLSAWVLLGLYTDGWAHNNLPGELETFFTPWHAVLYSGFLAVSLYYVVNHARNVARGFDWRRALPRGYMLGLFGVVLFGFGGGFDLAWHSLFGFEEDVEALLSPAHLLLAAGAVLFTAGPLRAAWQRPRRETRPGWAGLLPAWLALFQLLAIFTFFTQFAHFLTSPRVLINPPASNSFFYDVFGIASVLLPALLTMGAILFFLRRWPMPPGGLALLLAGNSLLMTWMSYGDTEERPGLIAAVLAGSVAAEVLYRVLRPAPDRWLSMRLFAFATPVVFFLLYFLALLLTEGTWWRIHMWLGVTFQAGIAGLLLSYLVFAPPRPTE